MCCVPLFLTPWTAAHQAPLSMGFSRPEYWSGLPFPPPGYVPDPGFEHMSFTSPALQAGFFFFFLPLAQHGSAANQHITSTPSPWGIPELQLTANIQNLEYFIHKFRVLTVSLIRRSDYSKLPFSPNERKPTAVFPLARICFLITCP